MSSMERTTGWQQIQQGVKEAERLIAHKEYDLVMVRTRQVLEYMVRYMAERTRVVEGDLSDTIDQLYEDQWINKTTKDNYHTIRILRSRAIREGDDTAYNANQTFQLLTQEMCVFANESVGGSGGRSVRMSSATRNTSGHPAPRQETDGGRSTSGRSSQRVPARDTRNGPSHQGRPRKKRRRVSSAAYILRLLIPVLLVILLIVVVRVFTSDKDKDADKTTTVPTVTTAPAEPTPTLPSEPETEPETEPPVETYRVKGNNVDVRNEPSTSGRIPIQLDSGTEVMYVKRYDNDWAAINYDSQRTYVSSEYIEKVGPVTSTGGKTEGSGAQAANQARVFVKTVQGKLVILDAKRERIQKVLPLFGVLQWGNREKLILKLKCLWFFSKKGVS